MLCFIIHILSSMIQVKFQKADFENLWVGQQGQNSKHLQFIGMVKTDRVIFNTGKIMALHLYLKRIINSCKVHLCVIVLLDQQQKIVVCMATKSLEEVFCPGKKVKHTGCFSAELSLRGTNFSRELIHRQGILEPHYESTWTIAGEARDTQVCITQESSHSREQEHT